jgi:hypothetical protein
MATWKYLKGEAKDFAHHVTDVNITSIYTTMYGLGFYAAVKEKEETFDKRYTLLARRELVTSVNDDRLTLDMVNHPSHYTQGGIECIDAIKAATVGKTGIEAVAVANVVKYLWRYEEKNGLEDVKKARWYLERLISELSEGE